MFDGSRPSSTGISFNDQQLPGPKLQADLGETLIRFRMHRFGLTADVTKMFRQVKVDSSQWNFQRILWRESKDQPIREYLITCVVWGFTSATFNAVRAMRQCAMDAADTHPLASQAVLSHFYVDDFLSGAESYNDLTLLRNQVIDMLLSGCFPLAKWTTSHPQLAQEISQPADQSKQLQIVSGVLGMVWVPGSDSLHIKLSSEEDTTVSRMTKRQVVSRISKLYDPSGLYAPAILEGKLIMQDLWRINIDWKEEVPKTIVERWKAFQADVLNLRDIHIPRWNQHSNGLKVQWHIFCDASQLAYGACIYLRVTKPDDQISSMLVSSKVRVAPIKSRTIPCLELLGAVTAVELWKYVSSACDLADAPAFFWTDSMIVLHWLRREPRTLKQFVANRISLIAQSASSAQWHHVPGSENPADLLSRGTSADQLAFSARWWEGPSWLLRDQGDWPTSALSALTKEELVLERSEVKASFIGSIHSDIKTGLCVGGDSLLQRASTLHKLIRSTAFVFRFVEMTKIKRQVPVTSPKSFEDVLPISVELRQTAITHWIRNEQKLFFPREWQALRSQSPLNLSNYVHFLVQTT